MGLLGFLGKGYRREEEVVSSCQRSRRIRTEKCRTKRHPNVRVRDRGPGRLQAEAARIEHMF